MVSKEPDHSLTSRHTNNKSALADKLPGTMTVRSVLLNRDSPDIESRLKRRRNRTHQVRFKDLEDNSSSSSGGNGGGTLGSVAKSHQKSAAEHDSPHPVRKHSGTEPKGWTARDGPGTDAPQTVSVVGAVRGDMAGTIEVVAAFLARAPPHPLTPGPARRCWAPPPQANSLTLPMTHKSSTSTAIQTSPRLKKPQPQPSFALRHHPHGHSLGDSVGVDGDDERDSQDECHNHNHVSLPGPKDENGLAAGDRRAVEWRAKALRTEDKATDGVNKTPMRHSCPPSAANHAEPRYGSSVVGRDGPKRQGSTTPSLVRRRKRLNRTISDPGKEVSYCTTPTQTESSRHSPPPSNTRDRTAQVPSERLCRFPPPRGRHYTTDTTVQSPSPPPNSNRYTTQSPSPTPNVNQRTTRIQAESPCPPPPPTSKGRTTHIKTESLFPSTPPNAEHRTTQMQTEPPNPSPPPCLAQAQIDSLCVSSTASVHPNPSHIHTHIPSVYRTVTPDPCSTQIKTVPYCDSPPARARAHSPRADSSTLPAELPNNCSPPPPPPPPSVPTSSSCTTSTPPTAPTLTPSSAPNPPAPTAPTLTALTAPTAPTAPTPIAPMTPTPTAPTAPTPTAPMAPTPTAPTTPTPIAPTTPTPTAPTAPTPISPTTPTPTAPTAPTPIAPTTPTPTAPTTPTPIAPTTPTPTAPTAPTLTAPTAPTMTPPPAPTPPSPMAPTPPAPTVTTITAPMAPTLITPTAPPTAALPCPPPPAVTPNSVPYYTVLSPPAALGTAAAIMARKTAPCATQSCATSSAPKAAPCIQFTPTTTTTTATITPNGPARPPATACSDNTTYPLAAATIDVTPCTFVTQTALSCTSISYYTTTLPNGPPGRHFNSTPPPYTTVIQTVSHCNIPCGATQNIPSAATPGVALYSNLVAKHNLCTSPVVKTLASALQNMQACATPTKAVPLYSSTFRAAPPYTPPAQAPYNTQEKRGIRLPPPPPPPPPYTPRKEGSVTPGSAHRPPTLRAGSKVSDKDRDGEKEAREGTTGTGSRSMSPATPVTVTTKGEQQVSSSSPTAKTCSKPICLSSAQAQLGALHKMLCSGVGPKARPGTPNSQRALSAGQQGCPGAWGCSGSVERPPAVGFLTSAQADTLRQVQEILGGLVLGAKCKLDPARVTEKLLGPNGPLHDIRTLQTQLQSLEGVLETSQNTIKVLLDVIQDLEKKEAERDGRNSYRTGQDIENCGTCRDCACIIYSVEHDFRLQEGQVVRTWKVGDPPEGSPRAASPQQQPATPAHRQDSPQPAPRPPHATANNATANNNAAAKKNRKKCFWFL